tara:strand:- start:518 stop:682 length:165 start_codon:yes stop_codon:yes gene_type:complete
MEPRISSQDAQAMMSAYAKVYAPKEEEVPETQAVETEPPVEDEQRIYPVRDYTP